MKNDRYSRQSFLGENSQVTIENCKIGIVGLGGGGSHVVQQAAHVGFKRYVLIDPDHADESNLNRTVTLKESDVKNEVSKVIAARRKILDLHSGAEIIEHEGRWQEKPELLRECDIIFGNVDGFSERMELETCARRHLAPYIDIGLDVNHVPPQPPVMSGQVILSMPNYLCMKCMGFLTDAKLAREAGKYGKAGINPQVVWANGVLASTAIGIAIDLITDWTKAMRNPTYLLYNGNDLTLTPHPRLKYLHLEEECQHYPITEIGEPKFISI